MSQLDDEEVFEPKLKKKKIDQCNDDVTSTYSEHTKLLFLDALDNHQYNSLLRKKLCSPTVVCLEKAELEQLNSFDLQCDINRTFFRIYKEKGWLISLERSRTLRVFDIESGKILFIKQLAGTSYLYIVECKNLMYVYDNDNGYSIILLDIEENFPVLKEKSTNFENNNILKMAYRKSKDELIVLFENSDISVFDADMNYKYSKYCKNVKDIHYDNINDELWIVYEYIDKGSSLSKHCGNTLELRTQVYNFNEFSTYHADLLFDLEFENFYIAKDVDFLILIDKSTLSPLKRIEITGDIYCKKRTQTIIEVKEGKAFQYRLKLDTYTIDTPIDRKICNHLESIGAKIPKLFIRDRTIPDSINYLTQIKPDPKFQFTAENFSSELASKMYELNREEYSTLNRICSELYLENFFEFSFACIKNNRLKKRFPEEEIVLIGSNTVEKKKCYVGVLVSELRQFGQCLTDFPVYYLSKFPGFDTALVKCNLSDFVQTLSIHPYVITKRREDGSVLYCGYTFDLQTMHERLKSVSLINPITLEIDPNILFETYRNITIHSGYEELKQIIANFQEQTVKIEGKNYLLADLLVIVYGRNLLQLDPVDENVLI